MNKKKGHPYINCRKGDLEDVLNGELEKVSHWLSCNKLILNTQKTKFMVFHNRQFTLSNNMIPKLCLNNCLINKIEGFSFLGIILNENVNWNSHIKHISKKITRALNIMNLVKFYVPKSCLKKIYLSLIHSYLNYGVLLWGYGSKKVAILQEKAIRLITNSNFLAHTTPLFKTENILKLEDIFKLHCFKFFYLLKNRQLPSVLSGYFNIIDNSALARTELELFECSDSNGKKRIRYHLPRLINSSPACIIDKASTHSLLAYKKYAKKYIIENYDETPCHMTDCYSCRNSRRTQ